MARIPAMLALALSLFGPVLPAGAAPREVEVTANGLTRQEAITNGLVQALEQVRGVALASASMAQAELSSSVKGDERTSTLTEQQQSATLKLTGGFVSGYRVLSVSEGPPVEAHLAVTIEVFEPKGLGNDGRRRIAVMAFTTQSGAPGWAPGRARSGAGRSSSIADNLRDRIVAHLALGRRFAVVDRAQDAAYASEARVIQSGNTPLEERTRLNQVIATDYVVTGRLHQTAATSTSRTIDLTGEVVTSGTAGSAEAEYQLMEFATRQVKFAGTAHVSGANLDDVAARIADDITQSLYPLRLIRFADPANLVIGQGGDALRPGQRFRAMVLGEAMTDPYTHESLGQLEEQAGIVEVKRVDQKMAIAQLVSGRLPAAAGDDVQIVLRPLPQLSGERQSGGQQRAPAASGPVRRAANGSAAPGASSITKLPFDP